MGPDELEWVDLTDFSPGIWEHIHSRDSSVKATGAPDGAAVSGGKTFGCVSAPDGGLVGMPKIVDVRYIDGTFTNDYALEELWAASAEAPSTPAIGIDADDNRQYLVDFSVIVGDWNVPAVRYDTEYPGGATPTTTDWVSDRTDTGLQYEPDTARNFAVLWEGWGTDTTTAGIFNGSGTARATNYEYKATQVSVCIIRDGDTTPQTPSEWVHRRCWWWGFVKGSPYWPSATSVNDLQKKVGYAGIEHSKKFYYDSSGAGQWFFGGLGASFWFHNDGVEYVAPGAWASPYASAGQHTAFIGAGSGSTGMSGLTSIAEAVAEPFISNDQPVLPTHGAWHAGRLVLAVAPNTRASLITGAGYPEQAGGFYKKWSYEAGRYMWSQYHGSLNNTTLHWTKTLVHFDFETGLADNEMQDVQVPGGASKLTSLTSVNAQKLFITTASRGAVVYEGDMNNPNILSLPSVESTYGLTPVPVTVNGGVVYGSKSGIFMWSGEDRSQHLSPQLHGQFWVPRFMGHNERWKDSAPRGRMAYRWPYVYVPNGWMLNMESGGWWQRSSPSYQTGRDFSIHRVDEEGFIWAARHYHDAGSIRTSDDSSIRDDDGDIDASSWPFVKIDPDEQEELWRWESQPLLTSRNRTIELRELSVVLQCQMEESATGQFYVGVWAKGAELWGRTIQVEDTSLIDGYPETFNFSPAVTGSNLQLVMFNLSEEVKTKLHRISYGWRSAERIRHRRAEELA